MNFPDLSGIVLKVLTLIFQVPAILEVPGAEIRILREISSPEPARRLAGGSDFPGKFPGFVQRRSIRKSDVLEISGFVQGNVLAFSHLHRQPKLMG